MHPDRTEKYHQQVATSKVVFTNPEWAKQPLTPNEKAINPYLDLAEQLFEQLFEAHGQHLKMLPTESGELPYEVVRHGFLVAGRGVERCVEAYTRHCRDTETPPEGVECYQALVNPKTTQFFTFISHMSTLKNREYEMQLGLRYSSTIHDNEFIFDAEQGCFLPNPELVAESKYAAIRQALNNGQPTTETDPLPDRCPAGRYIPKFWTLLVDQYHTAGFFERLSDAADSPDTTDPSDQPSVAIP